MKVCVILMSIIVSVVMLEFVLATIFSGYITVYRVEWESLFTGYRGYGSWHKNYDIVDSWANPHGMIPSWVGKRLIHEADLSN